MALLLVKERISRLRQDFRFKTCKRWPVFVHVLHPMLFLCLSSFDIPLAGWTYVTKKPDRTTHVSMHTCIHACMYACIRAYFLCVSAIIESPGILIFKRFKEDCRV